jgi:hypothetical protein
MQQRQPRLGDILDDYCPRERRVTNHAVVAMIGVDVKQTRCTTCDTEHEYKHAKVPRQRRKADTPAALYAQVAANAPKRVNHDAIAHPPSDHSSEELVASSEIDISDNGFEEHLTSNNGDGAPHEEEASSRERDVEIEDLPERDRPDEEDGPVHRPLIRASLPRPEGVQPPARPIPEFTIRQPGGRPGRFRPRHQRGGPQGQHFQGNRGNGNVMGGPPRGMRPGGGGGRPQGSMPARPGRRHGGGQGRKRSK